MESSPPFKNDRHIAFLGDDLVLQILGFIQEDLRDLRCLASTDKFFCRLIFEDPRTNFLFGKNHRQYWKNIYNLHQLVSKYISPSQISISFSRQVMPLNRLGILSREEERSSIPSDHPHLLPRHHSSCSCSGYFGFLKFPTEVAVWGDYSGLSFLPTMDAFLHPRPKQANGTLFGGSYQVMAVCAHENFLFLGFASGEVHCISMISTCTSGDGEAASTNIQEYPHISGRHFHPNEVSCLSAFGERSLVSACMAQEEGGKVMIHWGALEDGNLERTYQFVVMTESILSMASTTIFGTTLLQIGGKNELIITTAWSEQGHSQEHQEEHYQEVGSRSGHVVFLKYVGQNKSRQDLLVGLSSGEVVIFEHDDPGDSVEHLMDLGAPKKEIQDFFTRGYLEAAELIGDVLILAGGPFGEIYFYDWKNHAVFGSWVVHPGVSFRGQDNLCSTVIAIYFSHERGSLISLCRDGHVHEMSLVEQLERAKDYEKLRSKTKRARRQETAVVRPRPRRRTRSHTSHD
jgi:hypothetical protein